MRNFYAGFRRPDGSTEIHIFTSKRLRDLFIYLGEGCFKISSRDTLARQALQHYYHTGEYPFVLDTKEN